MDFQRIKEKLNRVSFGDKVAAVAVVFIVIMSYFYIQEQNAKKALLVQPGADDLTREERLDVRRNIVILGVDQLMDEDSGQRTDTIFILMFDPKSHQCSLLNVPRDTRVQLLVDGKRHFDKINAAYAYGGVQGTMGTLEEFLGIRIDYYLLIDVSGFKRVVDAIGGVDVYVEQDMKYDDFKQGLHINLKAGQQHLNGEQAMHYVRYRKEYGDIGRIRRQQRFIWAVQQKIVSGKMLMKIPGLTKELVSMVKTNIPLSDMLPMARTLYDMVQEHSFRMSYVPGTAEYLYDISYWTPYVVDTRKRVAELQGVPFEGKLLEAANKMADVYDASVAKGRAWQVEHDALEEEKEKQEKLQQDRKIQKTEKIEAATPATIVETPKQNKKKKLKKQRVKEVRKAKNKVKLQTKSQQ